MSSPKQTPSRRAAWLAACVIASCNATAGSISRRVDVDGQPRTYTLHVPDRLDARTPAPLVIAFHGGGGNGRSMERLSRFGALADRERFLVAFPDGLHGHWRDGRTMPRGVLDDSADDVAFVGALLDDVARTQALDARRIFATGMSNGAIFAHYLALRMPQRIAAIAPVAGGIATDIAAEFKPVAPVSVLIVQGRDDRLVPNAGGRVAATHGSVVSTDAAVRLWLAADGLRGEPQRRSRPAAAPGDCGERWQTWGGGRDGSAVTVVALDGGGHTWPGGPQYLPKPVIGAVCPELDATATIWEFFRSHPKPAR